VCEARGGDPTWSLGRTAPRIVRLSMCGVRWSRSSSVDPVWCSVLPRPPASVGRPRSEGAVRGRGSGASDGGPLPGAAPLRRPPTVVMGARRTQNYMRGRRAHCACSDDTTQAPFTGHASRVSTSGGDHRALSSLHVVVLEGHPPLVHRCIPRSITLVPHASTVEPPQIGPTDPRERSIMCARRTRRG
jgi:hypothetical protein